MAALDNGRVVKIGIVTADAAATARHFTEIFPVLEAPSPAEEPEPPVGVARSWQYHGRPLEEEITLTVANVHTENFWFEVIQPPQYPANPWYDHLHKHGQSVMWVAIHVEDDLETGIEAMRALGYETTWIEDKGFERYAYFDTVAALGLMVETKEQRAR